MDQVLVIDELLPLGGHVVPVEAEDAAVVRRVVDLQLLELGLPLAHLARGLDVEAGGIVQRLHQQVLAAFDFMARDFAWLEMGHDRTNSWRALAELSAW